MSMITDHLANRLLVAVPSLQDANFARTVSLVCQHDNDGAMGVVINRLSDYTLGELLQRMNLETEDQVLRSQPVLAGGVVQPERGFVIHSGPATWISTFQIAEDLYLTTSRDVLEALAAGRGPARVLVALGCASWSAGQLEQEIAENSWLVAPADDNLLFELPLERRWSAAGGRIGVDMGLLIGYSGRA